MTLREEVDSFQCRLGLARDHWDTHGVTERAPEWEEEFTVEVPFGERLTALEEEIRALRARVDRPIPRITFHIPDSSPDVRAKCAALVLREIESGGIYPSDFAAKYGFPIGLVLDVFQELAAEGKIEIGEPL